MTGGEIATAGSATLAVSDGDSGVTGTITNAGTTNVQANANLRVTGTLTNTGTVDVDSNANLIIDGSLVNTGTINLNDTTNAGDVLFETAFLSGTGTINFAESTSFTPTLLGASPTGSLTIEAGAVQSFTGQTGEFGSQGTDFVLAVTNNGTLIARDDVDLRLTEAVFTNTNGSIQVQDTARILLEAVDIVGGTLRTIGSSSWFSVEGDLSSFDGVSNEGLVILGPSDTLTLENTITNTGTIALNPAHTGATLLVQSATLAGTGTIGVNDNLSNRISASGAGAELSIAPGAVQTFAPYGDPDGHVEIGAGDLTLRNEGTLRAATDTEVEFVAGLVDNRGGLLDVADGGVMQFRDNVALQGGTLRTTGSGFVDIEVDAIFTDVLNEGRIAIGAADDLEIRGTLTNTATIFLIPSNSGARLRSANAVLAGTGDLVANDSTQNFITNVASGDSFTIAAGAVQTVKEQTQGEGGRIHVDGADFTFINNGSLMLEGNTDIELEDVVFDNSNGVVDLAPTAQFHTYDGSEVRGGHFTGSGQVLVRNAIVFEDVTSEVEFDIDASDAIIIRGTFTNNGTITMDPSFSTATIFSDDDTLAGIGTIRVDDRSGNTIRSNGGNSTLTIAPGAVQTIESVPGDIGRLTLDTTTLTLINQGTLNVAADTRLVLDQLTVTNAGGVLETQAAGKIELYGSAQIVGGTLRGTGDGGFDIRDEGILDGVTIDGARVDIWNSETLRLRNTVTNNGIISFSSLSSTTRIRIDDAVTLAGAGEVLLQNPTQSHISAGGGAPFLTNGQGHTIRGDGEVFVPTGNDGILAPGPAAMAGTLVFESTLALGGTSILDMELGGLSQGSDYDLIAGNDQITLGGQLRVSFIDGFADLVSDLDTFTLVDGASALLGSFTNVAPGGRVTTTEGHSFQVDYGALSPFGDDKVVLSNFEQGSGGPPGVPAPAGWLLLASGLVGLVRRGRGGQSLPMNG